MTENTATPFVTVEELFQARIALAQAEIAYKNGLHRLKVAQAIAEAGIIDSVGDERKLGSNETSRKRQLTIELEASRPYQEARIQLNELYLARARTQAYVQSLEETNQLYLQLGTIDQQLEWEHYGVSRSNP